MSYFIALFPIITLAFLIGGTYLLLRLVWGKKKWKHPKSAVRLKSVSQLDDLNILAHMATTDSDPSVKQAAHSRIEFVKNRSFVEKYTIETGNAEARRQEVLKMTDIAMLHRIAETDRDSEVKSSAIFRIALIDPKGGAGLKALEKITRINELQLLSQHAEVASVRFKAVQKMNDQSAPHSTPGNETSPQIRTAAPDRITDPGMIEQMLSALKSPSAFFPVYERYDGTFNHTMIEKKMVNFLPEEFCRTKQLFIVVSPPIDTNMDRHNVREYTGRLGELLGSITGLGSDDRKCFGVMLKHGETTSAAWCLKQLRPYTQTVHDSRAYDEIFPASTLDRVWAVQLVLFGIVNRCAKTLPEHILTEIAGMKNYRAYYNFRVTGRDQYDEYTGDETERMLLTPYGIAAQKIATDELAARAGK